MSSPLPPSCTRDSVTVEADSTEMKVEQDRPPSFSDGTLNSIMTDVFVGSEKEAFTTYRDLLIYWSPVFKEKLATSPALLELPDVDPKTFRIFLDWMLSEGNNMPKWDVHEHAMDALESSAEEAVKDESKALKDTETCCRPPLEAEPLDIDVFDDDDENEILEDPEAYYRSQPEAEALDTYIFANAYGISLLKNDILDSILEMNPTGLVVPSYSIVIKAWKHLGPTSGLHKYLIHIFGRNWTKDTDARFREELILRKQAPGNFWLGLLLFRERGHSRDDFAPWEENLCQYHDHPTEDDKRRCYWQNINGGVPYESDEESEVDTDAEYESDGINDEPEIKSDSGSDDVEMEEPLPEE